MEDINVTWNYFGNDLSLISFSITFAQMFHQQTKCPVTKWHIVVAVAAEQV